MAQKSVLPSIKETAFDCPHCGAYTSQSWYIPYVEKRPEHSLTPLLPNENWEQAILTTKNMPPNEQEKKLKIIRTACQGFLVFDSDSRGYGDLVHNLALSECFVCKKKAVWIRDKLLHPESMQGPPPNPDMSDSVRMDYEEASKILNLSPRGAAALLRLAIQKLCKELGEKGANINDDIASLVKKGLAPLIQKALDSVRVIGNEAVHPGTLDLKDDRDTASKLFLTLNIIVEQMISNPKHVDELFDKLPEDKKKGIDDRDKK